MTSLKTYAISVGGSKHDNAPKIESVTWEQFVARFAKPKRTACTLATCGTGEHVEYNKDGKAIGCKHKDAGYYVPATFSTGRKKKDVNSVSFLVVDADHLTWSEFAGVLAKLAAYRYVAHGTHSDKDGDRCVRVIIPLSQPVSREDWPRFWIAAMTVLGMPADPSCCDAGRLYYWPARPSDGDYFYRVNDGQPLDVFEVAKHAPPGDLRIADSLGVDGDGVVTEGKRHAMLVSTAGALRARGAGEGEILTALANANKRCSPPKGDSELRDIAKWASEQPIGEKWKTPPPADRDEQTANENTTPKWQIEPASPEWVSEPLPPREHLLVDTRTGRGAMDKVGVWLFGGAGGAGKSYATIALGLSVVSGKPWLDSFMPAKPGRVLIVAAEDDRDDIRRRVHAIARAEGIPADAMARFHVLSIHNRVTSLVAKTGDVYAPSEDTKSLCDELAGVDPYDLVVIDPYGRIAGVSVDADNAAAAATISALAMIASAARGLVLGITHTSLRARIAAQNGAAEGATGIRGATGQSDFARGVLRLEKDKSAIWLSLAKANHVAQWEPVGLRRGDHGELVPLDPFELAELAAAHSPDTKRAKREAEIAERDRLDDIAAAKAFVENPGASLRTLRAIVCKERRCGKDRADNAIARSKP